MKYIGFVIFTALLLLNCAVRGGVEGTVIDRDSGHPLANVQVKVLQSGSAARSNESGHYRIPVMKREFVLQFVKEGFEPVRVQAVEMKPGRWYRMDVALIPDTG